MWKFAIIAIFSLIWALKASEAFDNGFELDLRKPSKTGCNNTFNHNNSAFDLNNHTSNDACYWIITVTKEINLFFFKVFLHEKDELNIYRNLEDALNNTDPLLKSPIPSQNGTMTIITNETSICILLRKDSAVYERAVEGFYSNDDCSVPVKPDVEILYSPIYVGAFSSQVECDYRFNKIQHVRVMQTFTFEEFNMSPSSSVKISGSSLPMDEYTAALHPYDFFIDGNILTITVKVALNSTDHFRLKIHEVDSRCSGRFEFSSIPTMQLISPPNEFNNGTVTVFECRWLIESKIPKNILGLKFDKLDFFSVFDIIAVNDGRSEISSPLTQVTVSNRNNTQNQLIRASGNSMWVAFKPLNYESSFVGNVTVHSQGGYLKNNGTLEMISTDGDDTAFLLEVEDNKVVMLNFDDSSITPPAVVSVYDGFDTNNVLAALHGQVKFPVISKSSRMMVTGTKFSARSNHFKANFKGVAPSCNHMSSSTSENYILSENCNNSCLWIIPPQNTSNSALVVYMQYIALKEGDSLTVHKLDANMTQLVTIGANQSYIPHITVPSDIGVLINITQAECKTKTDKIVFIGHTSYVPACRTNIVPKISELLHISSPLYPDTYPVFSNCQWNVSSSKKTMVHMSFQTLTLAKNHCIKVLQNSTVVKNFEGKILPDDLFLRGDVLIDFDSSGCDKTLVGSTLSSDTGFLLNVTATDCGDILDGKNSGEFSTNVVGSQATVCIWKVSVPSSNGDSVNIISYVVNEKDKLKNYDFYVYDGSSVRDTQIVNNTESQILSRTNTLIFVYKRLNASQPSGVLHVKYNKFSCDTLCDNKICMHPDWKCNGVNDCGDFTDERNCASVPIPPEIKFTGYSGTAFWLCLIAMTVIGVILGVTVPVCYQKYRDSQYRRFHELDTS